MYEKQKCYFLTVEPNSRFDKAFEKFLEDTWLERVEGFLSCDSTDDYHDEDLFYNHINWEVKDDQGEI